MTELIKDQHERMLYTAVRVRSKKASGSGTIIYSQPAETEGEFETLVLTNHHVIEDLITVSKKWEALLQRERKVETKSSAQVETFKYKYLSREIGSSSVEADIMAYHEDMDLALLKLRSIEQAPHIATLCPKEKAEKGLFIYDKVVAVGAALAHPPVCTHGRITGFGDEIDNFPYWLQSSPTIFGNSGGAVFVEETYEFIGVPSRIAVSMQGFSPDAITHMSYFIPILSVYKFLEEQIFQYVYDPTFTSKQCADMRKMKREEDERKLMSKDLNEGGSED